MVRSLCIRRSSFALLLLVIVAGPAVGAETGLDDSAAGLRAANSRTIHVGPTREIRRIGEAARMARDGDVIEVDAGDYIADVAVWPQKRITIRGAAGRPRLIAAGAAAEEKAIWVIRGEKVVVENFEFTGAKVADRNGAGIRHETGSLMIKRCLFSDNENGILVSNNNAAELEIEDSEFVDNGAGDGLSHNLYVGMIASFSVKGSYFHRARVGHLLKTRARENLIAYNRLTDEFDGKASYELELPNGGIAIVIGNLIQQGENSENSTIVSFGQEGYRWPKNELYFAFNTVVNDRTKGGQFLVVQSGAAPVKILNNIFVGRGSFRLPSSVVQINNPVRLDWEDFGLAQRLDFRLRPGSKLLGTAVDSGSADGVSLAPMEEYLFPVGTRPIPAVPRFSPGAFQSVAP